MTALPAAHGSGGRLRPNAAVPLMVETATVRLTAGHVLVQLHGDQDVLTADSLREALADACARGRHVLVDLSDVRLIDSTALGLLVRAHQDAKRHGHYVCLVAPSKFVITVLHTMRLRGVFPDFPSRHQTCQWLAALP